MGGGAQVLALVRGIGSVLHCSGEERARSTLRVARGRGGAPEKLCVDRARRATDAAWAAAEEAAGGAWSPAFAAAREQLGAERTRVGQHARDRERDQPAERRAARLGAGRRLVPVQCGAHFAG